MLKRQRPSTPPTSLAIPSEFAETDPGTSFSHVTKRRRIVAPVLDGRERGPQPVDDDYIDDVWIEEEEGGGLDMSNSSTNAAVNLPQWTEQTGQYKHTNALLHQLHLEHQRRCQSTLPHASNRHFHSDNSAPSFPGQLGKFPHIGNPARSPEELRSSTPIDNSGNANVAEELSQVRARYEEHNRYNFNFSTCYHH
ncbi:hypothetical protein ACEPAI_805 [Sanghuangporus weigelae]